MKRNYIAPLLAALVALAPASTAGAESIKLRFAALPIIDMVPLYVADKEGLREVRRRHRVHPRGCCT